MEDVFEDVVVVSVVVVVEPLPPAAGLDFVDLVVLAMFMQEVGNCKEA